MTALYFIYILSAILLVLVNGMLHNNKLVNYIKENYYFTIFYYTFVEYLYKININTMTKSNNKINE